MAPVELYGVLRLSDNWLAYTPYLARLENMCFSPAHPHIGPVFVNFFV